MKWTVNYETLCQNKCISLHSVLGLFTVLLQKGYIFEHQNIWLCSHGKLRPENSVKKHVQAIILTPAVCCILIKVYSLVYVAYRLMAACANTRYLCKQYNSKSDQ